jgi:hypothetical protein
MYTYTIVITCKRECLKELANDLEGQFLCLDDVSVLGSEVSFQSRTGCILVEWKRDLGISFLNQLNADERITNFAVFDLSNYADMQGEDKALTVLFGPYPRQLQSEEHES